SVDDFVKRWSAPHSAQAVDAAVANGDVGDVAPWGSGFGSCLRTLRYTKNRAAAIVASAVGHAVWVRQLPSTERSTIASHAALTTSRNVVNVGCRNCGFPRALAVPLPIRSHSRSNPVWKPASPGRSGAAQFPNVGSTELLSKWVSQS